VVGDTPPGFFDVARQSQTQRGNVTRLCARTVSLLKRLFLSTIAAHMSYIRKMNKLGGDKISLLGLFILALIAARLTVALKSAIELSEPIPLPLTGLSVSMPVGNGWHSEQRWIYHDNAFVLRSIFALRTGKPTAWANCQYRLAAKAAAPEDRFAWKASEVDGEIVETGRTQAEALTIDWVRIERPDFLLTTFWGTAGLPDGRQLDIEVHQVMSDPDLFKRIFGRILESLSFKENALLDAGAEIVAAIKSDGLGRALDDPHRQALYLIKDATGRSVGFTMEALVDTGADARLSVRGEGFLYMRGRDAGEQETTFRCSRNLDEFTYGSRVYSREGRRGTEIVLGESGAMTVRILEPQTQEKTYYPGSAALPDMFFDQIFRRMLDRGRREIVVDLIDVSGQIIPMYISRIETASPEAAYIFDVELLDGQGFSQQVYLDEQRQIYRSLIRRENTYVLERTSKENIMREFPEHARRFLRNGRML
jgi:hypothetical protein